MYKLKNIMWLYAVSSIHAGSGDDLNYIDLPIQRERHTGFPKIEASTMKGGIRYAMEAEKDEEVKKRVASILGKAEQNDFASAVAISDARLLFFPVKSAKGIFAWVTCPFVVRRFMQDCKMVEIPFNEQDDWLNITNKARVGSETKLQLKLEGESEQPAVTDDKKQIMLDEFIFDYEENDEFSAWLKWLLERLPEEQLLKNHFLTNTVLINDNDFEYFVTQSTEVITRIRVDNGASVAKDTALFTEEYLPPESILYCPMFFTDAKQAQDNNDEKKMSASDVKKEFEELLCSDILQIGGDMTLGKGLFYKKLWPEPEGRTL